MAASARATHVGRAEMLCPEATAGYRSAMRERPALFLGLLADQPELIAEVGVLRWRASGQGGTAGPWIESTARDAGQDGLPLTLVAMGIEGQAIGAVTLGHRDDDVVGCDGLAPWLVRMVVHPDARRCGVGRLMVSAAEDLARERGFDRIWVASREEEFEFYRQCGWAETDQPGYAAMTVLCKTLDTG